MEVIQVINQVLSLEEATKRIPDRLKDSHPYSANAVWIFYLDTDHTPEGPSCMYCQMFDGQAFLGSDLRAMFPDHYWKGDDIYANVHKTLWGKDDTCACLLIREPSDSVDLENVDLWQGTIGTDWTKGSTEK
jgi:hypothetical protein